MKSSVNKICVLLKAHILARSSANALTRSKTKLARPNVLDTFSQNGKEQKTKFIGPFGYLMLGIPIGTFFLGTWQVQRRAWKLNLLNEINKNINEEPHPLPEDLEELNSKDYYPIKARGRFLYDREFTIGPRSLIINGKPTSEAKYNSPHFGYYVITPFELEGQSTAILVNRGWVPQKLKDSTFQRDDRAKDVIEITGLVRQSEKRPSFVPRNVPKHDKWYYRDVNDMANKANTEPVYVEMVSDENVEQSKPSNGPIPGQTCINIRNDHLSYIITWYSLSLVTGYMWYSKFIRKLPIL